MPRIQHIWLRVELLNYTCYKCRAPQSNKEAVRNNVVFTKSLWKLLDILSRWEKTDANHGQQLALELSAHSPCDSEHLLKGDIEHQDDYPYRAEINAQRDYIARHPIEMRRPAATLEELFSRDFAAHDMNNLVLLTPNMKNLAVSFVSDAKDCLQPQPRTLPKLESIALTSQHWLEPTQEDTQELLHLAAKAALLMPNLQIMEIWTCGNGHAAIFRYEATGTAHSSAARLTWRCSWDAEENPIAWDGVIEAWRHVATTSAGRELRFTEDPLPQGSHRYEKYGAILHQLKLRNLILDPISVMQVRMGTGAEDEPEVEEWRPCVPDSYWSHR
ncbi:hypothetical protein INS49_010567 [Diaporthe citri]|uniref:uncharacterized protein n=1 Tax=Diaporthe citri TaxID=83186 RepID=UPI001C81CD25|nr:uncharacterized protein INS49_010567 [Diaporthe citri]KAG6362337.1 hypothetical protein INS49_010567 [Diaporthe citri]